MSIYKPYATIYLPIRHLLSYLYWTYTVSVTKVKDDVNHKPSCQPHLRHTSNLIVASKWIRSTKVGPIWLWQAGGRPNPVPFHRLPVGWWLLKIDPLKNNHISHSGLNFRYVTELDSISGFLLCTDSFYCKWRKRRITIPWISFWWEILKISFKQIRKGNPEYMTIIMNHHNTYLSGSLHLTFQTKPPHI